MLVRHDFLNFLQVGRCKANVDADNPCRNFLPSMSVILADKNQDLMILNQHYKRQPHKMVKHIQTIRCQFANVSYV